MYPIPQKSRNAFLAQIKGKGPHNPGLLFDRFAPDWEGEPTRKKEALEQIRQAAQAIDVELLQAWHARWQAGVSQRGAASFTLQTDWRFIAGLGKKGALEVGFTFNRYGFPYLPGSSVKGVARAYALYEIADNLPGAELIKRSEPLNNLDNVLSQEKENDFQDQFSAFKPGDKARKLADSFRKVFGTTAEAGKAIFFDAIPEKKPVLDLDIMNPHYPDYYQGKELPADWQNPQPVYFLTVAPRTPFRFAIDLRGEMDQKLFEQAKNWLVGGLAYLGAGGKTSAGYGYFVEPQKFGAVSGAVTKVRQAPKPLATDYRRGTVKDFGLGPSKSFGFITPDGGGKDVFVHISALSQRLATLVPGQRVIFKPGTNPQGKPQALDVQPEE